MHKTARLAILSGLALAMATTAAMADQTTQKRKKNLFESLFGVSSRRSVERDRTSGPRFGRKYWEDNGSDFRGNYNGIRIISGMDDQPRRTRNVIASSDDDPEGDSGIGMGNLSYVADKTIPLNGQKFAAVRPNDAAAGLVYDALTAPAGDFRVRADIREAIAIQYLARNFQPLWIADGKLTPRAVDVLKLLAAAGEEGLEAERYLPPALGSFTAAPPAGNPAALAELDIEISAVALRYAHDASGGQFDPRRLSLYNDVTPAWVEPVRAMKILAYSPFAADYLKGLHPAHPAYAAMKAALAQLRTSEGEASVTGPIADGPIVKKGKADERIPAVRQRLAELGYPEAQNAATASDVLDADLSVQLRLFQKESGIKVSGLLGPQTVAALNSDRSAQNEARLLDNMERLRWLPKALGQRYVFVNQAAFEVRVMDQGKEAWKSRVIVGKPMTQTAVFNDEMETVVFNPSWGVPPSIIANEYLPKLRDDPSYLDRIGFKVVDAGGKVVRSSNIDWWSYGSKVPFGIQQPPGDDNALGELKFLFPNAHNIYMHDTPSRNLFAKDVRAFSHGCVRVQNPREFAQVILGWSAEKVDANVDSKKSQSIKLPVKVPVHITYFTAWPDESGKIVYYSDIYGRDKTMETARNAVMLAQR